MVLNELFKKEHLYKHLCIYTVYIPSYIFCILYLNVIQSVYIYFRNKIWIIKKKKTILHVCFIISY